jgi:hypothetical protein
MFMTSFGQQIQIMLEQKHKLLTDLKYISITNLKRNTMKHGIVFLNSQQKHLRC